jgi:alginate O-acetyltransferase complex protein AlgI
MLFNSYPFLVWFLPATLLGYIVVGRTIGRTAVFGWLVLASLAFYAWWSWFNLLLLIGSILFNYVIGTRLGTLGGKGAGKALLAFGLAANVAFLGYFKYADFFISNVNTLVGTEWPLLHIVLPLGISFYTFQKVAYLVDSYKGLTRGYGFRDFCLFVSFFPQLIAGPITHHGEIMPQFRNSDRAVARWEDWSVGFTLFAIGLGKKVLIADRLALIATPVFRTARLGADFGFAEAWLGVLAYTLQLYFDFSGYSDMATGLARLFGIRLPTNFNSPYQATSIIDFWRRWHMTLSRFLRDYVYIPLGGNRCGMPRRYLNLFLTMLIGGIWHGAGWTFVIWGALHGTYLLINHAWRGRSRARENSWLATMGSRALTFLAVTVAWVFFRAETVETATSLLGSMIGLHGINSDLARLSLGFSWVVVAPLLVAVWVLPNSLQILAPFRPTLDFPEDRPHSAGMTKSWRWLEWKPTKRWALAVAAITVASILGFSRASEFIYWQF